MRKISALQQEAGKVEKGKNINRKCNVRVRPKYITNRIKRFKTLVQKYRL